MSDDPTVLLNHTIIEKAMINSDLNTTLDDALDFATTLLYHLEDALEIHYGFYSECQCMSALHLTDLKRGYCLNCFGAITVRVCGEVIKA